VYPPDLKYSKDHEWARVTGDRAVVGITQFAEEQLGDVVYVDFAKKVGEQVKQFEVFGTVESVKAASDLFSPLSGTIVRTNDRLADHPELVNQSPYDQGWMLELRTSDPAEVSNLLPAEEYEASLPKD
jgi:glycine cleavage system H protein